MALPTAVGSSPPRVTRLALVACVLLLVGTARGQIIEESGSFREFLAGSEPAAAYDNWISHVAEHIARPGYNVYAPPGLDTQQNGFGAFDRLDEDDDQAILQLFRDLTDALMAGNAFAAQMLLQNGPDINYELVQFTDPGLGRVYLMLRETLDTGFEDPGLDPGPEDDVIGSFQRGWGLYVFRPQAARPEIIVQVPHPCDDYISPYIGLEFFLEADAGLLMINGAGREVLHSGETFANDRSLSDPTRNCVHPFQMVHERSTEYWQGQGQNELVIQVHSYDDLSHRDLKSCVVVGGRYNRIHNPVLVDTGGGSKGLFTNLLQPVFPQDGLGWPHDEWHIDDYMSSNHLYPVILDGGIADSSIVLPVAPELWGYGESCQWNYTFPDHGEDYPECDAIERAIHIEIDELPTPAHGQGEAAYYNITPPAVATWQNFTTAWAFAQPLFDNLLLARDSLRAFVDDQAPTVPGNLRLTGFTASSLDLFWVPTLSDVFDSYEVLVDTLETIGPTARVVDADEEGELCWPGTRRVTVHGLELGREYTIGIRARDAQGRVSALSNLVTGMPDDLDAPRIVPAPEYISFAGEPVAVSAVITDEVGVASATLEWDDGQGWQSVVMENLSGNTWTGTLQPMEAGRIVPVRFTAVDATVHGNTSTSGTATLSILHDLYTEGFDGTSDYTHSPIGASQDQWHLSTTRVASGSHSWKFGSTTTGSYNNNAGGWLESPSYTIPIGARQTWVRFSCWVAAEASGSQPDSCYDGGLVEISPSPGVWQSVNLSPPYTHGLKASSQVPLSWPRGMLSGNQGWLEYSLPLPEDVHHFRLRFGFVSDISVVREGWYVDELRVGVQIPEDPDLVTVLGLQQLPGYRMRLEWLPVFAATSYRIHGSDTPDGETWTLLGETDQLEYTVDLEGGQAMRFFRVTTVVPDALARSLGFLPEPGPAHTAPAGADTPVQGSSRPSASRKTR
jgi:hypothetical protein